MKFLIEYDRTEARLLRSPRQFGPDDTQALEQAYRLAESDYLLAGRQVEVVVLEADSLGDLAATHGRYFKTLNEMGQPEARD
jgi:electron transfer flavoprotein alpha/beta subunit